MTPDRVDLLLAATLFVVGAAVLVLATALVFLAASIHSIAG